MRGAAILKEILQRSSQLAAENPEKAVSLDVHLVLSQRDLSRLQATKLVMPPQGPHPPTAALML